MGIPAGLPWYFVPLHRPVPWNHILDDTGQHMADVGLPIGCRRTVVEHVEVTAFPLLHALLEDVVLLPELLDSLLTVDKIQIS